MSHRLGEVCVHGSLARSCELCELNDELERLREFVKLAAMMNACLRPPEPGTWCETCAPCVVTLQARSLLDVATDDKAPWRNNDCPHGYGFDDCCHHPSECVATDDPPVPYRALEGSEGGEDGQ